MNALDEEFDSPPSPPTSIRLATPDDWRVVRDVRLHALQEAPYAFGSTYAREVGQEEAGWRDWISGRDAPDGAVFLAYDRTQPVGMVGCYLADERTVKLVAMWVDPAARRTGVGRLLVRQVVEWSREHQAAAVQLGCADDNQPALDLYLAEGFRPTGRSKPLPSDPARQLSTYELALR